LDLKERSFRIWGDQIKDNTYPVSRRVGHVACMGKMRNANVLIGRSERKRQLGRCRDKWEDSIKNGSYRNRLGG
jgi:hypothetical protein